VRDGEALRRIGKSAELFEDHSPLQLGATGRWMGRAFRGGPRSALEQGTWNEWHLLFDAGEQTRVGWLSEDNGQFAQPGAAAGRDAAAGPAGRPAADAGRPALAGGRRRAGGRARRRGRAAARPRPGRVIELRNAQDEVGTLENGADGPPVWSVGRGVQLADLACKACARRPTASSPKPSSRADRLPQLWRAAGAQAGETKSMVCAQCNAVVDLPEGEAALGFTAGARPAAADPAGPHRHAGRGGRQARAWQVVGYQERCDLPEDGDDEQSFWRSTCSTTGWRASPSSSTPTKAGAWSAR
jgi:hypothetical protein